MESRPELQARGELTREQLQAPLWLDGTPVNLAELEERHKRYGRRCSAQLGRHACRAIRARLAAQRGEPALGKASAAAQPVGADQPAEPPTLDEVGVFGPALRAVAVVESPKPSKKPPIAARQVQKTNRLSNCEEGR